MSITDRTEKVRRFEGNNQLKWLVALCAAMIVTFSFSAPASAQTRSLKLYFLHTKERAEITYMRNGRYDQRGLQEVNRFLRDWRRNEPAKMDPRLLDLLWEVYRSVGARDYIHVVSAYRSPATNKMLRSRSSGVAENSQHTLGKAIDFFIPGVPLSKLRAAGFKAEGGGVGFYPKSGSPFVHLDVGNVRSWPRMSRNELMALFPDGRTIHVPSDGKPLPGYQQAMAAYKSRQASGGRVQIASASSDEPRNSGGGLLAALFGSGNNSRNDASASASAPAAAAPRAAVPQPTAPVAAPVPQAPETIIAALPSREVPLPVAAPRPVVDVGAPATAPLIAGLPERPTVVPSDADASPVEVALNIPLPTPRPNYAPEPAQAVQVASAASVPADLPVSAIAAERSSGNDAISEMLAMSASDARADVVISAPVPSFRPAETAVARAGEQDARNVFVLASLPSTAPRGERDKAEALRDGLQETTARKQATVAALSASPRVAVLDRAEGMDAASALDSGVRTTPKGSKPSAAQARPDRRPVAVPIEQTLTRWAFVRDVTVSSAGGSAQRDKAHDIVWSAPDTVYTEGFQQEGRQPDASRFSGKAVTFLSVARFQTN